MKSKRTRAAFATIASLALAIALVPVPGAYADSSSTILTLGADLTDSEQDTVLDFFGLDDEDLEEMEVITVTNEDEREYLEGTLSDSVIGYKTLSCSYIQLTSSGGIDVETANLTYVTKNTIYNALQTAGVENCNVVVTAPYDVSGTGALTGIFMAVEADGTELDEDKKEAATEELVETAELEDEYGEDAANVVSDVKDEVNSSDEELSDDEISSIVEDTADGYGLSLSEEDVATITDLASTVQDLDYDVSAFSDTLSSTNGILASIQSFFESIVDFFKGLFGGESSIMDDLDTDVIELDDTSDSSDSSDSADVDDTSDPDANDEEGYTVDEEDGSTEESDSSDSAGVFGSDDASDEDASSGEEEPSADDSAGFETDEGVSDAADGADSDSTAE